MIGKLLAVLVVVVAGALLWLKFNGFFDHAPQQVTWERTYGGPGIDEAARVLTTADGGALIAGDLGEVAANGEMRQKAWILRLDGAGKTLWQRTWGDAGSEHVGDLEPLADGGYVVTGETDSAVAGVGRVWVARLDAQGQALWQRTYESKRKGASHAAVPTKDGGYLVAGKEESDQPNYYDGWIARIDAEGTLLWERFLGGASDDSIEAARETGDGGFIVVGSTESKGAGRLDAWVIKLDADGKQQWEQTFGSPERDAAMDVQVLDDGGYIVAGWSDNRIDSHKRDGWVIRLDSSGKRLWDRNYGGRDNDEVKSIRLTADGGFVAAGTTRSKGEGEEDAWVVKLDGEGNLQWERAIGGRSADAAAAIAPASDGAYVVAGREASKGAGREDAWVLRIDATGRLN